MFHVKPSSFFKNQRFLGFQRNRICSRRIKNFIKLIQPFRNLFLGFHTEGIPTQRFSIISTVSIKHATPLGNASVSTLAHRSNTCSTDFNSNGPNGSVSLRHQTRSPGLLVSMALEPHSVSMGVPAVKQASRNALQTTKS